MTSTRNLLVGISLSACLVACGDASSPAAPGTDTDAAPARTAEAPASGSGQAAAEAPETESDRLNAWFDQVFEDNLARSPMYQTYLGRKTNYGAWNDASPEFERESYEIGQAQLAYMRENFDHDALDESARLSWRLFEYNAERAAAGWRWRDHGYTFTPRSGPHMNGPAFLINNHRIDTVEDAEAYVERLRGMGDYLDQHIANSRRSAEMGVLTPDWTYAPMIETARNVITGAPFRDNADDSPLLADFRSKVDALELAPEERDRLIAEAETALVEVVEPAYERVIALFEEQAELASGDDGVWKHPDGGEFYNYLLNNYTTMDLSAEEIHQLGLQEVDRIHGEMRAIMEQVGFEGSLQDFFEFMRTDDRFYYPNTNAGREAYLADATALIDTMRDTLPEMFNTFPEAELEVRRVEPLPRGQCRQGLLPAPGAQRDPPRRLLRQSARHGRHAHLPDGGARLS